MTGTVIYLYLALMTKYPFVVLHSITVFLSILLRYHYRPVTSPLPNVIKALFIVCFSFLAIIYSFLGIWHILSGLKPFYFKNDWVLDC